MTRTVNLSEFASLVQVYAASAPWPSMMAQLRRAAIEFCERTRCWRHVVSMPITDQDSIVVAPFYAAIHEFETAEFDGEPLTPLQFTDGQGMMDETGAPPRYITQKAPNTVRLLPFAAGKLDLTLFLKPVEGHAIYSESGEYPADDYDQVPRFLYTNHAETIAAGALVRILTMPGQDFTNPQLATMFNERFESACNSHFGHSIRGQQRAPVRTRGHYV
ncbi:hypothetical protein [Sediminimonas sp.]|uniref:phage adaptor protein n=1 Tax=Sediminimonas sp. TaxID=2823379 RepID=UPI0025FA18F0|nr:hypothetical protein [Sediminimonas sp.]